MRIDAHPLIVAVALGLLGPAALSEEDEAGAAAEAGPVSDPGVTCWDAPDGCDPAAIASPADRA